MRAGEEKGLFGHDDSRKYASDDFSTFFQKRKSVGNVEENVAELTPKTAIPTKIPFLIKNLAILFSLFFYLILVTHPLRRNMQWRVQ